jgi:4-hydroxy-tetrahydrodipicolinate synthase
VVAGVGTNSTEATLRFAEDALDVGADALLVVTPYYNKPPQRGLIAHYTAIARATHAPIIVYNVPGRTSVDIRPETIAELAELPEIVAVKDATGSLRVAGKILALCGDKLALLSGDDFTALALIAVGGRGCISVVGNVDPRRTSQMINAALRGDLDRSRGLDRELMPLTELLFQDTNPIPVKAAVAMLGFGSNRVRSPLAEVEPGLADRLRERLRVLELID